MLCVYIVGIYVCIYMYIEKVDSLLNLQHKFIVEPTFEEVYLPPCPWQHVRHNTRVYL